jgi:hypothetical protein
MSNSNPEGVALAALAALGIGLIQALAKDVEHDAYSQETHVTEHVSESPIVHAAHTFCALWALL